MNKNLAQILVSLTILLGVTHSLSDLTFAAEFAQAPAPAPAPPVATPTPTPSPSPTPVPSPTPGSSARVGSGTSWGTDDSFLCPEGSIKLPGFSKGIPCDNTKSLAEWVWQISIWLAASIAVFLVILGGYFILTSAGNPDRIKKGKDIITNALIGLVFITLSGVILRIIGSTLIGLPIT